MKIKWVSIGLGKKAQAIQTFSIFNWINNDGYTMCGLHQCLGQSCNLPKCKRCQTSIENRKSITRKNKVYVYGIPLEVRKLLKGD